MKDPPTDQYAVTCQMGRIPDLEAGMVVFVSSDAPAAWRYYYSLYPLAGTSIALWDPNGDLMATRIGSRD
ncbi:hypothetical protein N825_32165 [Skermanella stibiiresistens SB22]|uniref:Uncharacterized protein n=1 Tax=Skermanella stibiiresistens SB22 TaxID=1385369 RepID=W9GU42_9PROT|nr:hypothetical protein [Skermanella stibiiresistens]EWY35957.1 hypothetical protein N825_32165 [Skermanella stibiiresistens SB22]